MSGKLSAPPPCEQCGNRPAKWFVNVELGAPIGRTRLKLCGRCAGRYPRSTRVVLKRSDW